MKKCYMLEFIKEISFDKLKNIYEKQKFGKCFQHIKETRKKKKKKGPAGGWPLWVAAATPCL
jgi:hypothetical protein